MAKIKTAKEALSAVQQDGTVLQQVPENLKTAEVCLAAIQQNGWALEYVPKQVMTVEVCLAAVVTVCANNCEGIEKLIELLVKHS